MAFINYASRVVNLKIVYYGPEQSGKADNIQFLHDHVSPESRGALISLATEGEPTLMFDFLPLGLGNVRGFKTRFHLYSVPGQSFYDASRKLILRGVDGVVFVADSRRERMEANVDRLVQLEEDLAMQGHDPASVAYVLQLNKRNAPTAVPVAEMKSKLRILDEPVLEAVADSDVGIGVVDTLKAVGKLVLVDLTSTDDEEARWAIRRRAREAYRRKFHGARSPSTSRARASFEDAAPPAQPSEAAWLPTPQADSAWLETAPSGGPPLRRERSFLGRLSSQDFAWLEGVLVLVALVGAGFLANPTLRPVLLSYALFLGSAGVVAYWRHHRNHRDAENRDAYKFTAR